jgi:hypothetical protein
MLSLLIRGYGTNVNSKLAIVIAISYIVIASLDTQYGAHTNHSLMLYFRILLHIQVFFFWCHTYGTINDTIDIIWKGKKGKHLNILTKYHIHKIGRNNFHMNDTYNPIFETLHDLYTR